MKKLLLLLIIASLVFIGCEKKETIYQIFNNNDKYHSNIQYLDGSFYEVIVIEYFGNDVIKQVNIDKISYGCKSGYYTADEKTEKIKISFKLVPRESPYYNLSSNNRLYTLQYYYLEKYNYTIAELNGNTLISGSINPSRNEPNDGVVIEKILQEFIEK